MKKVLYLIPFIIMPLVTYMIMSFILYDFDFYLIGIGIRLLYILLSGLAIMVGVWLISDIVD